MENVEKFTKKMLDLVHEFEKELWRAGAGTEIGGDRSIEIKPSEGSVTCRGKSNMRGLQARVF